MCVCVYACPPKAINIQWCDLYFVSSMMLLNHSGPVASQIRLMVIAINIIHHKRGPCNEMCP